MLRMFPRQPIQTEGYLGIDLNWINSIKGLIEKNFSELASG